MLHVPSPTRPVTSYSRSRVPSGSVWPGKAGTARRASSSSGTGVIVIGVLLSKRWRMRARAACGSSGSGSA